MSLLKSNVGITGLFAMMIFTSGCVLDHVTTYYGLSLPTINEANQFVLYLIGANIWNIVELLMLILGNSLVIVKFGSESNRITIMAVALTSVGIIRLFVGVHNILLITSVTRLLEIPLIV